MRVRLSESHVIVQNDSFGSSIASIPRGSSSVVSYSKPPHRAEEAAADGSAARWGRRAWELLERVRARAPLVQCITNFVSMDLMANVLLAAGASPAMVHSLREIDDFTPRADSLCVNIGTLSDGWLPSMRAAAAAAARSSRPWILDPVAVSASEFRMEACLGLVALWPTVIRGNPSEIIALTSACRVHDSKVKLSPLHVPFCI
ncbi:hypothetical protein BHE74_00051245 [Ensete ventricosum]|nr:hypothetical protein BHE74_00051245 [Ensete ventricosum]